MPDNQGNDDQAKTEELVRLMSQVKIPWKSLLTTALVFVIGTLVYFYGLNMVTYPWAYKLTPTTPQGNWIGTLKLRGNQTFLVNIDMKHDTQFHETKTKPNFGLNGHISICGPRGVIIKDEVWGNPKWTGSSVVLGTNVDFGARTIPERVPCKSKKDALECVFDFEHPLSRAEKEFREDFKEVYTPKAEFTAKIPISLAPLQRGEPSFAQQCQKLAKR
jgi:hypothetical protein